jgi:hypothetical protein
MSTALSPARLRHTPSSRSPAPKNADASDETERRKRDEDERKGHVSPYRKVTSSASSSGIGLHGDDAPGHARPAPRFASDVNDPLIRKALVKLKSKVDFGIQHSERKLVQLLDQQNRLQKRKEGLEQQLQKAGASADSHTTRSLGDEVSLLVDVEPVRAQLADVNTSIRQVLEDMEALEEKIDRYRRRTDPDALLDSVHSTATKQKWEDYIHAWKRLQAYYLDGEQPGGARRHLWNLAAGCASFSLLFGPGTVAAPLIAAHTGMPLLGSLAGCGITAFTWTLCEPLITMIAATNVSSPALEAYGRHQRLVARKWRESIAGTSEDEANSKYAWTDPVTGKSRLVNAAGLLLHTDAGWWKLWKAKVCIDDLPYAIYAGSNTIRNFIPDWTQYPGLYDQPLVNAASRFGTGAVVAGPLTRLAIQLLRKSADNAQESVTMPPRIWARLADYLASLRNDCDTEIGKARGERKEQLRAVRDVVNAMLEKAQQKSGFGSSILYEWKALFQRKREAVGDDPETPGKRLDTAASFIGKLTCQLPGVAAAELARLYASAASGWVHSVALVAPPVAQIFGGFIFRREAEAAARVALGGIQGLCKRISFCCSGCGCACCCCEASEDQ